MNYYQLKELLTGRWIDGVIFAFAALAWGSTALQLARGLSNLEPKIQVAVFMLGLVSFAILVGLGRKTDFRLAWQSPFSEKYQPLPFLLLGVILRLLWVVSTQATPTSDGATYLSLAHNLLNGADYETSGTRAYWPPGYPAFLAVWIYALPPTVAIPISQTVLFVIGALGIFNLTKQIAGSRAANTATFLFAAWPNLVALVATPEKEALLLALLPWIMLWTFSTSARQLLLAGTALGAAVLVQPSLQLLIPAIAILLVIRNGLGHLPKTIILFIGATLVIAPWTIRNFVVFNEFKLVSTNGGDNFYRANNKLATGGYTEQGEIDLSSLDELEKDKKGKELATQWIMQNPRDFVLLAIEKQIRFMGDDAAAIYSTFRSDGSERNNKLYVPLKLVANAWWLLAWLCIAILVIRGWQLNPDTRILVWGWIYLFLLHSIFESAGKYHMPMSWVLCIVLGSLFTSTSQEENPSYSSSPHR